MLFSPPVQVPALPAQYHYKKDGCGTEVIYLAGRDTPLEEGEVFPLHASRFWLSAGADAQAFQRTLSTLSPSLSVHLACSLRGRRTRGGRVNDLC